MGILQARILEWVVMSPSRGSSQPRNWTGVSYIVGRFFTSWATREAHWIVLTPYIFWISALYQVCSLQLFSPFYKLFSHFVDCFFCYKEVFGLIYSQLIFAFVGCTLSVISIKNHCEDQCQGNFSFSFKSFMVSGTFKSLIHFIFVYDVRYESSSILFCVNIQFSQNHLWKRPSSLLCPFLTHLSNTSWWYMYGFISGLSVLLHWSVCLVFMPASCMHVCHHIETQKTASFTPADRFPRVQSRETV